MSAFIVPVEHIDALLAAALSCRPSDTPRWRGKAGESVCEGYCKLTHNSADAVGKMLVTENVRSVGYRYGGPQDDLPCMPDDRAGQRELLNYRHKPDRAIRTPTVVEALKLIDCYEYQSCEHDEWETSEAFRFCAALRSHLIHRLPGYSQAPWDWDAEQIKAELAKRRADIRQQVTAGRVAG